MSDGFWGTVVMASPPPLTEKFIACRPCWRGNHDKCPDLFPHPTYGPVACHCDHSPGSGPMRSDMPSLVGAR